VTALDSIPRWRLCLYAFVAGALTAAVVAVVAVAQGFVSPPVEREVVVQTRIREQVRTVTQVEYRDRVQQRTITRDVPVVLYIDGGVRIERELVTVVDYQRETDAAGETKTDASRATDTSQKSTERPVLPSWSVGVLVGGQFAGTPALKLPNAPGLVVGIEAGYRVPLDRLGLPPRYSVWVTGWGTTSGAAGGGLRGEF
jgi:hypothetical protein